MEFAALRSRAEGSSRPGGNKQEAYLANTSPLRACFPSAAILQPSWLNPPGPRQESDSGSRWVDPRTCPERRGSMEGADEICGSAQLSLLPKHGALPGSDNVITLISRNLPTFQEPRK